MFQKSEKNLFFQGKPCYHAAYQRMRLISDNQNSRLTTIKIPDFV